MSKVVSIRGYSIASPGEPAQDVIAVLRELLERAEAGDITGVAGVGHYADGSLYAFSSGHVGSHGVRGALFSLAVSV